jgi:hypothetical protein
MKIFVTPKYMPQAELTLEEINKKLELGDFDGSEPARTSETNEWTTLDKIDGVTIPTHSDTATEHRDDPKASALESLSIKLIDDQKKMSIQQPSTVENDPPSKLKLLIIILVSIGWILLCIQAFISISFWSFTDESALIRGLLSTPTDPTAIGAVIGTFLGSTPFAIMAFVLAKAFLRKESNFGRPLVMGSILMLVFTGFGIFLPVGQDDASIPHSVFPGSDITQQEVVEVVLEGMQRGVKQTNSTCPIMLDNETRLDSSAVGPELRAVYYHTFVNYLASELDPELIKTNLRYDVMFKACKSSDMIETMLYGAVYEYVYHGKAGIEIARFEVNRSDCEQIGSEI